MAAISSLHAPQDRFSPVLQGLRHEWFAGPEQAYAAVSPTATVKYFRSLAPQRDYFQFVAHLPINNAHLMGYGSSDLQFGVEACPDIHVVICFGGTRCVVMPHGAVACTTGGVLLIPPGERDARGASNNAVFTLKPREIAHAASAMAGGLGRRWVGGRGWPAFQPKAWPQGLTAQSMHSLVHYIDACARVDPTLPAQLALDDVLHRQVAALLDPSLLQEVPADGELLHTREGKSAFDDLIDYIRDNLDQPLRLSDLEARSHYSRRSLQDAFLNKLQCSPKQWIRQQRLQAAMAQLIGGEGASLPVHAVALRCGYKSLRLFSADFQRQFGVLPSEVRHKPLSSRKPRSI